MLCGEVKSLCCGQSTAPEMLWVLVCIALVFVVVTCLIFFLFLIMAGTSLCLLLGHNFEISI